VRDALDRLGDQTAVAVVTFSTGDLVLEYTERLDLPFPVLADAGRHAYRAYGLGRTSWRRAWGLRAARRYAEILRDRGLRDLARPTEDTRQLGGDFVISPEGVLTWARWSDGPDDRPSVDQIAAKLRFS